MSKRPRYNFGGKFLLAISLALFVGFVWACVEIGRTPADFFKLFSKPSSAPPQPSPRPVAKESVPSPPPIPKDPEPVPALPAPSPAPTPRPLAPKPLSSTQMDSLFNTLEDHLHRGRIFEARQKIQGTNRLMIPLERLDTFRQYENRLAKYHALLLETTKGGTVEMPQLARLFLKSGGRLVVKILEEREDSLTYETITGIRSTFRKDAIESLHKLDASYSAAEVKLEMKKQADYRGIDVEDQAGRPLVYRIRKNKKVTGLTFFDLADFCARNGANNHLTGLFDEALKVDPDLLATVHEAKGERMVNVLLFFLSIHSAPDSGKTLEILRDRYADTRSYRERVEVDPEIRRALEIVLGEPEVERTLGGKAGAGKPATDPPSSPAPAPREIGQPSQEAQPPSQAAGMPLPSGVPPRIADLMSRGDRHFEEGMSHLRNSDPNVNPEGWTAENKRALEFFMKANEEGYLKAQEFYAVGEVPQALLDRVRETTMRASLCRKRSVSSR